MVTKQLNCLHYGYYWTWRPASWGRNIRNFFRTLRWAKQRITRGYCDWDTWEMDSHMTALTADMLEHLAKNGVGWCDRLYDTPEEWHNALYTVAHALRNSDESTSEFQNRYEHALFDEPDPNDWLDHHPECGTPEYEELSQKWHDEEKSIVAKREDCYQAAMKWIVANHRDLWD